MTCGCPSCIPCWQKDGIAVAMSISEASTTVTVAVLASAGTASPLCFGSCCFWERAWVLRWFLRFETVLNVFPHSPQACGRSPVCVRRCSARCMLCTKPLSQNSHRNGRSPECVRRCSRRCVFWRNLFPQIAQGYGRSPVWTLWCSVTLEAETNSFPHTGQGWDFPRAELEPRGRPGPSPWLSWCRRRFAGEFKRLPQIVQSRLGFVTDGALCCSVSSVKPCWPLTWESWEMQCGCVRSGCSSRQCMSRCRLRKNPSEQCGQG